MTSWSHGRVRAKDFPSLSSSGGSRKMLTAKCQMTRPDPPSDFIFSSIPFATMRFRRGSDNCPGDGEALLTSSSSSYPTTSCRRRLVTLSVAIVTIFVLDELRVRYLRHRQHNLLQYKCINYRNPYYHTPQDSPDTLDFAFLAGNAQHIVNATATLLNQEPEPSA